MSREMKRLLLFALTLPMLAACGREKLPEETPLRLPQGEIYHGLIQLGDKLEDPYTVENMQEAFSKVYPTKAGRVDIRPTDLYVRFLPKDDNELKQLEDAGLYLLDHPMDYQIVREGDYYRDPLLNEESITWQYAVVPQDFVFPEGIRCEVLDRCYISEHDPMTRLADGIDWTLVEREAFRLTGNEDRWVPPTRVGDAMPRGRITVVDPAVSGGKPFGLAGVKVVANVFVKIGMGWTDRDGYYQLDQSFSSDPRYRLVFQNEKGFSVGLNLILIPASVSTLGTGSPEGVDFQVDEESDPALFRRSVVNNAAWEYYARCTSSDLEVSPPPGDLRIWIMPMLSASSSVMLHHGAFLDQNLIQKYLGEYLGIIKIFLPDVTIGTDGMQNYQQIYRATVHELAHASHYAQVGNLFWGSYIRYVIESFVTEGGRPYGSGLADGAGYCEIGEMWAYFLEASLFKDRYGGSMPSYSFWFKPEIFSYLYERGMTRGEIFRSLKGSVTSTDDLKEELIRLYGEREDAIRQTFNRYGK